MFPLNRFPALPISLEDQDTVSISDAGTVNDTEFHQNLSFIWL